jgi:sugar phosphate isomerase/epimerase
VTDPSRREFLKTSLALGAGLVAAGRVAESHAQRVEAIAEKAGTLARGAEPGQEMSFGLVTYLWGKDWDVPTLIRNCTTARLLGVELRTGHAHKVEPSLNAAQRAEVKKRFADSPVRLVGIGSAEEFHHPDPARLAKAIEATKAYVKLARDVGASGVKVRPNDLPKGVPQEKTIEQIGKTLNLVGGFAADYGQQIRLEIHGGCAQIPIIKQIIDIADNPNVGLCWNSNASDLKGDGLAANFKLLRKRFGQTAHVRALDSKDYPFAELIALFVQTDYRGWVLLEGSGPVPKDPLAACIAQRRLYDQMVAAARAKLK